MMTIAEFILNAASEYNGHKQTELNYFPLDDAIKLIEELQNLTNSDFSIEVFGDRSYSLSQKDYWKEGEHTCGHRDRLVLSVNKG